mmetsp:Transcript_13261/g.28657  ORF Transcript_13261/g.28657 Transcript_13261/m.28657 type:complete len:439 (+) Transcript_13261:124-1440(+)
MPAVWKSRAETMISHLIDGEGQDPRFHSVENSSTSNPPAAACAYYDSVYDRLLGCGCVGGQGTSISAGSGGPCMSLFLQWVKLVLGGTIKAYHSSPLCLAMLPLAIGAGFGFWMGRRSRSPPIHTSKGISVGNQTKRSWDTKVFGFASQLYHWLSLQLVLVLIFLDPRRCVKCDSSSNIFQDEKDEQTREELKSIETKMESGVELHCIPRHVAVIMDGNRRYGKAKYGNATRGHWDGSKTLMEFTKWCQSEGIRILTVYAFSTENWDRDPAEVSALMSIFRKYCDELRVEAVRRGIRIHVLSTEEEKIPKDVGVGIERMVQETKHCDKFTMNICLSYGGRGEIVNACKSIALDVQSGVLDVNQIGETDVQKKMLTGNCCDPDIIIRTSGEERLSNFLLWQVAYSEFFFLKKQWPELRKEDLLKVIRAFAHGRKRRYGK